jgi:hypothetical protein
MLFGGGLLVPGHLPARFSKTTLEEILDDLVTGIPAELFLRWSLEPLELCAFPTGAFADRSGNLFPV